MRTKEHITIKVEPQFKTRLKRLAAQNRRTVTSLILDALASNHPELGQEERLAAPMPKQGFKVTYVRLPATIRRLVDAAAREAFTTRARYILQAVIDKLQAEGRYGAK